MPDDLVFREGFDDTEVPLIDLVPEDDTPSRPTPPSPAPTQSDLEVEEDRASCDSDRTLCLNDFHNDVEEDLALEFGPVTCAFHRSNATFFS